MNDVQEDILTLAREVDLSRVPLRKVAEIIGRPAMSPGVVQYHISQLESKKLLYIDRKKKIQRLGSAIQDDKVYRIPIVGAASCGPALMYADERAEGYINVSKSLLRARQEDLVAIRAEGDSMNRAVVPNPNGKKAPIYDGDYVIIDTSVRDLGSNVDGYVLTIIGGLANIKKLMVRDYDIALMSESSKPELHPPIIIGPNDDAFINGRVVMVCERA
ncbi:MAG: S24 family peptidase [Candidatus Saccharimonadales bacterium]